MDNNQRFAHPALWIVYVAFRGKANPFCKY